MKVISALFTSILLGPLTLACSSKSDVSGHSKRDGASEAAIDDMKIDDMKAETATGPSLKLTLPADVSQQATGYSIEKHPRYDAALKAAFASKYVKFFCDDKKDMSFQDVKSKTVKGLYQLRLVNRDSIEWSASDSELDELSKKYHDDQRAQNPNFDPEDYTSIRQEQLDFIPGEIETVLIPYICESNMSIVIRGLNNGGTYSIHAKIGTGDGTLVSKGKTDPFTKSSGIISMIMVNTDGTKDEKFDVKFK